jgi:hypothetical protein
VKIGVVGEFNAGKSLLLGSLIGYADALPISEVPTTGNVTALWFRPRPELRPTEIAPFRAFDPEGCYGRVVNDHVLSGWDFLRGSDDPRATAEEARQVLEGW